MAEIINKTCTSELKKLTKNAVVHFIKGVNDLDQWSKNYLASFVMFATCVHHDNKRFSLSLIDQQQRGVPCYDVQFVTENNSVCFFMEIIKDATCMSATAKQYRQSTQQWLANVEPTRFLNCLTCPKLLGL